MSKSPVKFGINGFGRIGRTTFRAWWSHYQDQAELVVINTSGSMELAGWAHLLKYDTNYRTFPEKIEVMPHQSKDEVSDEDPVLGELKVGGKTFVVTAQRDPAKIPWKKYQVHSVLESTGVFRTAETASAHLKAGAESVVISAPAKGDGVAMGVLGVNQLSSENQIVSNASCTTNCVAPVAQIMHQHFEVEKATMTTIHAYTDDQNIHDNSHRKDLRRARAAALNIIPTSTGAAKATGQVIPELEGLFDGLSVRVPAPVGSLSDMVFVTKKSTTVEEVNQVLTKASQEKHWQGILAVTDEPIVSSDIIGDSHSSIVDLSLTQVVGDNLVKVISWYDNEMGYCHRLVEQMVAVA